MTDDRADAEHSMDERDRAALTGRSSTDAAATGGRRAAADDPATR